MSPSKSLGTDQAIARKLRHTWPAFFARHGRLLKVQREVIPLLLDGANLLVCSPTASGKTEAVCAPLVERNYGRKEHWLILYISPTRALVNDLYERLAPPLDRIGVKVARRTGDHHDNLPSAKVLLTTPESFDSLLCRAQVDGKPGHILAPVVGLVLDEIHLLHGNPRGEQLRWLIERLRRLKKYAAGEGWVQDQSIQIVGLSATVPNPEQVKDAYLGGESDIVTVGGAREIETVSAPCEVPSAEKALPAYLKSLTSPEKVLVFSNTRKRVDSLTGYLRKVLRSLGYTVRAHHGSLTKRERESAEDAIKKSDNVVLVATSTLEIGIDIGDIDLIVLDGPAPDVPALLQRIGRGNRRTDKTRVMTCAGNVIETVVHSAMIDSARSGELGTVSFGPCYSVAIQQAASYIFQSPNYYRSESGVQSLVKNCIPSDLGVSILNHAIHEGEFTSDSKGLRLGEDWLEKSDRGDIHSNIESSIGLTVVDRETGDAIAHGISFRGGKKMELGGHLLKVTKWQDRKLEVIKVFEDTPADAAWGYLVRGWKKGDGQPQAVRRYLGYSSGEWPVIYTRDSTCVFHFGGSRRQAVLELMHGVADNADFKIKLTPWYLEITSQIIVEKPFWVESIGYGAVALILNNNVKRLENLLNRPHANKRLPMEARIQEVDEWLNLEEEMSAIKNSEWVEVKDELNNEILQAFWQEIKK